jgi:hypothetical protein
MRRYAPPGRAALRATWMLSFALAYRASPAPQRPTRPPVTSSPARPSVARTAPTIPSPGPAVAARDAGA